MEPIRYSHLRSASEMEAASELQTIYWGNDGTALVSGHMLLSIANYGGQILGAYDQDRLVGLLIGFIGADVDPEDEEAVAQRLLVMSKRMVVLPEYRSQKIGEQLKLYQRDYALRHGIPLVTWTFDPMLSRNAYLNLHKLAAVGQRYVVDYFGAGASHPTLSADRLVVNWWVEHPQTAARLGGPATDYAFYVAQGAYHVNPAQMLESGLISPGTLTIEAGRAPALLEIPADFVALDAADAALGRAWRDQVKQGFQSLLGQGLLATDFVRDGDRSMYVFTLDDGHYTYL